MVCSTSLNIRQLLFARQCTMWIVLSTSWDLGDVRAALTIIISVLCSAGIWTMGYCFWLHQANHVAATASVRLYSLYSIQSVGDALDVLTTIVWNQKLSSQHALLLQCTIIFVLSLAGAFAGPLAKWSTRTGLIIRNREVPGYLATSDFGSGASNFVKWNQTIEAEIVKFPSDRAPRFPTGHRS